MSCKCAAAQGPPCPTCGGSGLELVYLNEAQLREVEDPRFQELFRHEDGEVRCVPESELPVRSKICDHDGNLVQVDIVGCDGRLVFVPGLEAPAPWLLGFTAFVLYVTHGSAAILSEDYPGKIELGQKDDQTVEAFIEACRLCMQGILGDNKGAARLFAACLRSAQRMWPGCEEVGGGGGEQVGGEEVGGEQVGGEEVGGENASGVETYVATTLDLLQTSGLNWLA